MNGNLVWKLLFHSGVVWEVKHPMNYQKYTFIAHINCQSILSTIDEFAVTLKSYEFDIISLRETWLTNNQHQLDYVNIAGYKSIFKHRKDKKGAGIGFYIKENISFKTSNNLKKSILKWKWRSSNSMVEINHSIPSSSCIPT